jgi:hypothetical protein
MERDKIKIIESKKAKKFIEIPIAKGKIERSETRSKITTVIIIATEPRMLFMRKDKLKL